MNDTREGAHQATIRTAIALDSERLAVLCGQLGYPASVEQVRRRLDQIQQDAGNVVYVVESADGQVIGWVQVYTRDLLVADRHAEVGGLVVEKAQRRRGLGRMLMEQAEAWAHARGCRALYLRSNVIREEAHRFYVSIGYSLIKTQRAFLKDLERQQ